MRSYVQSESEGAAKAAKVELYRQAATESGCSLTQLALQFVSGLEGVSVTLLGVSRLQQLDSLLANGLPSATHSDSRAIPHFA
jgi:aryl-alcohol dehydrogenase-like predicted oxidoreductase